MHNVLQDMSVVSATAPIIFVDCEWNGHGGDLISMALVDEDGKEFYEVLPCDDPTDWVASNVIPVLGKTAVAREIFNARLAEFLARYDELTLVADWPEDIAHFCRSLVFVPLRRIGPSRMNFIVDADLFGASSTQPHNALADARAIREYYLKYKGSKL